MFIWPRSLANVLAALGLAAGLVAACGSKGAAPSSPPASTPAFPTAAPTAGSNEATIGQPFDIKVGQSVTVSGTAVRITFQRVDNDSRCPIDVTCVRAGDATLVLEVQGRGEREVITLITGVEETPKATAAAAGLAFTALVLAPAPISTQPLNQSDYTLRLVARQA